MKYSLSLLSICILSFIIVYSCSTEEDDTTAPNVVQTSEPEPPAPTQYSLTVTAGEGVTVSTEGGTYDGGTEITITATPIEGYRFVGWEGCSFVNFCEDVPNDIITYENTITFNLNSNVELRAVYYLAVSSPPDLVTNSGYEFYYNFSDGMPLEWVSYFKDLMIYFQKFFFQNNFS